MSFNFRKYSPFPPVGKVNRRWPDNTITKAPQWCAVDLRDGNQALVKPMNVSQKQRLFEQLVRCGFKHIEIGFPAASQPDFDFCRGLITEDRIPDDVTIQVLTQARSDLVARTYEALDGVKRAIVHVYNSTSTVQREQVFQLDQAGIKAIAVQGARDVLDQARQRPDTEWTFQYSPESFTGTELDFAVEVIDAVNDVWRPDQGQPVIINLPSTVELATPNIFADQVEWVCDHVRYRQHITISLHAHNDRGCAVAASELGVMAGADRIEGTLLGNGERTGNMDLITMAMNLYTQGTDPELNLADMADIIDTVEACTEIQVHPRHPYAGELVFTAFSGSHQDAIRKCLQQRDPSAQWNVAYLPLDPADLGRRYEEVVRINSQSGKGGVTHILERDYNINLPRWLQIDFAHQVQKQAEDSGGEIDSLTIHKLFREHYANIPAGWRLVSYDLHRQGETVTATIEFGDDISTIVSGSGHGALEALAAALESRFGIHIAVEAYDEFALSEGTDAKALACIKLSINNKGYSAVATTEDTTTATLQVLLNSVGRFEQDLGFEHSKPMASGASLA